MSRAAYRAAAMSFVTDYAADVGVKLQAYPGRPRTIFPPCAFVDRIPTTFTPFAGLIDQSTPRVDIIVLHGLFDSADAVAQADAFLDGVQAWSQTRYHQAGANTLIRVAEFEDIPDYVPEWLPPEQQRTYFASRITLEGFETV